jgi:hypothetical protein
MSTYESVYYPTNGFLISSVEMMDENISGGAFHNMLIIGGKDISGSRQMSYIYTLDLASVTVQDITASSPLSFKKHMLSEISDEYTSICYNSKVDFKIIAASKSNGIITFFEISNREAPLQKCCWRDFRADSCGIKIVKMGIGRRHELLLYTLGNSPLSNFQIWENVNVENTFSKRTGDAAHIPEHFTCIALEDIPGSCILGTSSGRLYRYSDGVSPYSMPRQISGLDSTGKISVKIIKYS